ncbi:MAG: flagellar biosynthesis protein FlhA [Chloroflexi bacterium]|nr:flagellar biosynthesis protein FlhA [Chloroflexota bacterium]
MSLGMPGGGSGSPFGNIVKYTDLVIAGVVIGIVGMLIIPLPPHVLDILLSLNIAASVITILISIYIKNPLEFAVFPPVLLVATLFRLALDVSATRMILLNGHIKSWDGKPVGAGEVIPAFGQVVVGGNLVVGFIIFIILIIIQFMVITSGAERIAQVAARFTLDAMPGKQMAIDADLHSGLIDAESAKMRRTEIEREADFYGAMDGAGKFVKGDAMAAVVIMIVNVIGGLIIGIVMHHMSVGDALNTYAILSIGNGLVTTLPAFLMSTSMGMVVSRAASEANLGTDLVRQITAQPRALKYAAIFLAILAGLGIIGLFPLPWVSFAVMAIIFYVGGLLLERQQKEMDVQVQEVAEQQEKETRKKPESVVQIMQVDPISLEVGRGLLSLVDPNQGAKLLERVTSIRRHIALEMGIVVPGVRFRDNLQLKPNAYVIKIKEIEVATGDVMVNQFLAIGPEEKLKNLRGTHTVDPTYGMPGVWIAPENRGEAERQGCMIFDPVSVIATQLTEVIRSHGADLLGRQEVQALIDTVKKTHPAVVKELIPDQLALGEVQKVLQNLVRERVSVRDLVTILETIADNVTVTKDTEILTECVRVALSRVICKEYMNNEGVINVITLDPEIEQIIRMAIQRTEMGTFLALDPNIGQQILTATGREVAKLQEKGLQPILLCSPEIRPSVRKLTDRSFPNLVVLSWNEIAPRVNVNSVGMVSLGGGGMSAPQMPR